ncbi:helix-turn-helix transcriptional regulator [Streptomyces sp. SL13]|uniref:Helix-turn-helix transcriptional regulator n=1 Tax=Streptantibioticus silvisoli TaxID=2705255 RepID=A0AA90JYS2_9ACTN|nr:helix-turn-helix transcriptional regulator [Streptantibioticus silvisoli]MDI5971531.1 helix-turn-helix transcriptional regulator [Streptantibioticus silvisoli]
MSKQAQEAREALGARLRGFRKDAGFASGRALARALEWQESKVSRLENGKQNAGDEDIRAWCLATGQEEHIPDLIATARHIEELWLEWRRQLQTGAETRQKKSLPVYARTKVFRIWNPNMIWGTFQTAEYAAEVFEQAIRFYEFPDDRDAAVAKRLERQRYLYEGERIYNVILGEQAIYSKFGGPDVMRDQLDRLVALMGLPRVSLGIVPDTAIWLGHSFSMFDDKRVLVETFSAELSVTQPRETELYARAFGLLRQSAVYGEAARDLILTARQKHVRRHP